MYNHDTDLLFPPRLIPALRDLRGPTWRELVERVSTLPPTAPDRLSFLLLMVKLHGCAGCQADSYKAMHGCTQCALQTLRRFHGDDDELLTMFQEARREVTKYLQRT